MEPKKQYYENVAKTIIKNLEKRQMEGYYCEDGQSAVKKVLELMPKGSSIGWGGSMTLTELGVFDAIQNGDYEIFNRDLAKTKEEQKKVYSQIVGADYFLMSSNAITLDGELVNIDGRGNRVSFLCFGPENVIVVVGMNKIATNAQDGMNRVRNIAAPPNTVRLNKKTPCATTGMCGDCYSPDCICCQLVVTRKSATPGRIKVILVGEELGY
ncbi:MAG: lactate utilization protein [Eubacteriales bacterium]|nr:lactate utilization protein [Eubacteriales bacterium]